MSRSMRSKNKARSSEFQNVSGGEQTLDALSPPYILMTGTNDSKVESMQDRFNFVDSGVSPFNVNKGAGNGAGQGQMRCNTEVQNHTQQTDDANSDSTGQYYDAQYQFN